jgi:hypothetical protein
MEDRCPLHSSVIWDTFVGGVDVSDQLFDYLSFTESTDY